MDIQCQCFLNIRDDNNISFTEIYRELNPNATVTTSMATIHSSGSEEEVVEAKSKA